MHPVEIPAELLQRRFDWRRIQRDIARTFFRLPGGKGGSELPALRRQFAGAFRIRRSHAQQEFREAGQAITCALGKIGAAVKRRTVRSQEHRQRPAAAALCQQVMRILVDLVEVGAFFPVHLDIDEMPVHHRRHFFILETFMRHHVAPVAGGIADGEQDRLALLLRQRKRLCIPRMPVHRVAGVLQQVRAGFLRQRVGHEIALFSLVRSAQQRLEFLQYILHQLRLRLLRGMQIIGLELFCRNALEQERQQPDLIFFRQLRIHLLELRNVSLAVIRRQPHADQQHLGAASADILDDFAQISFEVNYPEAAQPVVRTQCHDHHCRTVLLQCPGDALPPAQCRLAADAGVDDAIFRMAARQLLLQQAHPTFFYCDAVSG